MERIRSFIAIEIPPDLGEKIGEVQNLLRQTGADVKWTRPEGIHLTLKFLGERTGPELEEAAAALSPPLRERKAFPLSIRGLGVFPSPRSPRVLWARVDQGREEVSALQETIEKILAAVGFPPEDRPFTPHLTLGRMRSGQGRGALIELMERHREVVLGSFRAREVHLFRSELHPSGAVYTKLKTFVLEEEPL
ncbi:MAG: RNA 2',3'-cyclic phosphodiesterase [Deltaproteobacteria bacterium]|nr:RNA 2',3'-cyclic phosphodiesterase [Deltaproteobacteria bacterium]